MVGQDGFQRHGRAGGEGGGVGQKRRGRGFSHPRGQMKKVEIGNRIGNAGGPLHKQRLGEGKGVFDFGIPEMRGCARTPGPATPLIS